MSPRAYVPDYVYYQLAHNALTAVIGVAGVTPETQRTDVPEGGTGLAFRDWDLKVERYIQNPQPLNSLIVRSFIALVTSSDPKVPLSPIQIPSLSPGQRVLLLLDKWEPQNTHLEAGQFTIAGVHAYQAYGFTGFLEIDGANTRMVLANTAPPFTGPWEPIERIAGLMTSPVPITPPPSPAPTVAVPPTATNTPCPP